MDVIIVPTDFSENAEKALDQALLLAQQTKSELELLHTIEIEGAESAYFQMRVMRDAKYAETRLHNLVKKRMSQQGITDGIPYRVHVLYKESFDDSIVDLIKQTGAKLVVMGSKGSRNWTDKLFGSHTSTLIGKAVVPVLCIPLEWAPKPIYKLAACLDADQVKQYEDELQAWGQWLACPVEWVHFSSSPVTQAAPVDVSFSQEVVTSATESPLFKRIVEYSQQRENIIIAMFVQPRSIFKKLFDPSLTKKTAELITAPLLALPAL